MAKKAGTKKVVKKDKDILDKRVRAIHEEMKKKVDLGLIEKGILSNQFEFVFEDKTYRVSKPSFEQKQKAYDAKMKKHYEMLMDEKYVPEEVLIAQYKKRGIDLNEYSKKINVLEANKNLLNMKLGEGIKKGISESTLHSYKNEIENICNEQQLLSIKRQTYLEISIETQCNIFLYNYLTMLIVEKKNEDGSFSKMWDTYDDFLKGDEKFIMQACFFASLMIHDETGF